MLDITALSARRSSSEPIAQVVIMIKFETPVHRTNIGHLHGRADKLSGLLARRDAHLGIVMLETAQSTTNYRFLSTYC